MMGRPLFGVLRAMVDLIELQYDTQPGEHAYNARSWFFGGWEMTIVIKKADTHADDA